MNSVVVSLRILLAAALCCLAASAQAQAQSPAAIDQYVVTNVDPRVLAEGGFDRHETGFPGRPGSFLVAATADQAAQLRGKGATVRPLNGVTTQAPPSRSRRRGKASPLAPPTKGYNVFRPWSLQPGPCPGTCSTQNIPLKDWYHQMALRNRDLVKEVEIGRSVLGQPIMAYKVTDDARRVRDGRRPAVLYNSTQHAREWISTEVIRRLFNHVLTRQRDREIRKLLRDRELWFVPVVNPDGYDYTFVSPASRLWRKNLRDNDSDNAITEVDGVDPNRNWTTKWNWDLEGSSNDPADETFHGQGPSSEPEVAATRELTDRIRPKFQIDYHSFGGLILYPEGWQVETPATDAPIFQALGGDSDRAAVEGFDPEVSAQLYTTNGDVTDDTYSAFDVLAYTVELTGGSGPPVGGTDGSAPNFTPGGFVFQDDEAAVQAEFEKNLAFALDLAKSADRPDRPDSHLGNEAPALVPTTFPTSNGSPQTVEVNAKRSLGRVTAHWTVNGRRHRETRTTEWEGGSRYGHPGEYYHRMRAQIDGMKPGDKVRVWFTADRGRGRDDNRTTPFEYTVASDSNAPVLLMVAEDYSGRSSLHGGPPYGTAPLYREDYEAALTQAGIRFDTYDVDANGRTAATNLGVMSHYKAVVWETGDDAIVRGPDQQRPGGPDTGAGTGTEKLFDDEVLGARDYMNEGGKLLVAGQLALEGAWQNQTYNPLGATPPRPFCPSSTSLGNGFANSPPGQRTPCRFVSDDFQQYWLGAYSTLGGGDPSAATLKELPPMGDLTFGLNGEDSKQNQLNLYRFLTTSNILPPDEYPQFDSHTVVEVDGPPAYDPPTGSWYAYSDMGSSAYKRLQTTVDMTGRTGGNLTFKVSHSTESDFDYVFVEAHTVGQDDWTTLPEANGQTSDDTGAGCPDPNPFWLETHPFLRHYITRTQNPDGSFTCTPTGTSGAWNASTGNSNGFHEWEVPIPSQFDGQQIELSITYATDPAVQGLGTFVDDVSVTAGGESLVSTGFEDGTLAPFTIGDPPEGSARVFRNWHASQSKGFEDGPGVRTANSVFLGFGLEGVTGADNRARVLGDGLRVLGVTPGS